MSHGPEKGAPDVGQRKGTVTQRKVGFAMAAIMGIFALVGFLIWIFVPETSLKKVAEANARTASICPAETRGFIQRFRPGQWHDVYVPTGMTGEYFPAPNTGFITVCAKNKLTMCVTDKNKLDANWARITNVSGKTMPLSWEIKCKAPVPKSEVLYIKT